MSNELRIDKILDFYDEPQLFIARDKFGAQYICLLYADDHELKYTAIKISNDKLSDFRPFQTNHLPPDKALINGCVIHHLPITGNKKPGSF